jgi:inorganic triphosphatase YgiF
VKKKNLITLMESVTVDDLKMMISIKGRLEELERKKKGLEKSLALVVKEINAIQHSIFKMGGRRLRTLGTKKARKKFIQPSLATFVVDVLKERKKPLKIEEIYNAVLHEKKYRTQAKNFKGQLRILLYKNEKGLFKKTGPGVFTLAANSHKK